MPFFNPKSLPEEAWKPLTANRDFAVRLNPGEEVHLRFGPGGVFVTIKITPLGKTINSINLEDGTLTELRELKGNEQITVGRGSDCVVKIINPVMSRTHAQLYVEGNIVVIKDLGSTNGTYFHVDNFGFDIESYLEKHAGNNPQESTMDEYREAFGPPLDDFLNRYKETHQQK